MTGLRFPCIWDMDVADRIVLSLVLSIVLSLSKDG